ncbi:MAG TPA: calcium-binding protein, partial [Paucimonas sp.]|nr:calcium-binding protein [Paucimonas sp.]
FIGGTGNDRMTGYSGADTYLYHRGDGQDTIYDYDMLGTGKTDRIVFGAGISAADIQATRSDNGAGYHLVLTIIDPTNPAATDRLTIQNWYHSAPFHIETLEFADGTIWSEIAIRTKAFVCTAGNDTLAGFAGHDMIQGLAGADNCSGYGGNDLLHGGADADVLDGGDGNDLLIGGRGDDRLVTGTGADIVAFNRGDGRDTIVAGAGRDDTITLGHGIRYADLEFARSGDDLLLLAGADDRITLANWYAGSQGTAILQLVIDGTADYDPAAADELHQQKVAQFDFGQLALQFDAARAADPALAKWALLPALADAFSGGSDTAAIGGGLAYHYAQHDGLAGIPIMTAQATLNSAQFGTGNDGILLVGTAPDASQVLL